MSALVESSALDKATFLGMVLGLGLLVVAYFFPDLRFLAAPALLVLFPSLIYGMR